MATQRLGIIMHGVTGRMGMNQHLIRSVLAIRSDGGVQLANGDIVELDPIRVGRNAAKVEALAKKHGVARYTDDLDAALANEDDILFFDAGSTQMRADLVGKAISAGKHVYCEKPLSESLDVALDLARKAENAGVKNGVVHDKLYLPGILKLKALIDDGSLGDILSVRIEFGYWVFQGDDQPAQRPSWNYRKEDGGGIILDMLCHWRYVLDNVFAPVKSISCLGKTHLARRWDENGDAYEATADDAAYVTVEMAGGIIAQINSSWCTRVNREDLVTFHVDGTEGSAVAGLFDCKVQTLAETPRPVWNPDEPQAMDFFDGWKKVAGRDHYENGFRAQWEEFIRHVVDGAPYSYTLRDGAKGVQLAELGLQSWQERRWLDVPDL